jgi:hypothetical protein
MKKTIVLLISFFLGKGLLFAQKTAEKAQGHHSAPFNKPDATVANIVIWVSVSIVVVVLVLSIKYLVKPNEGDPKHIKNIVKDEGF